MTWVWQLVSFTAVYFIAGRFALEFTYLQDNVTLLIWPPAGIALAVLILFGRRFWPGIVIGTWLINLGLPSGGMASVGVAIGNTLEALISATLLVRVADFRPNLERLRDGVAFLLIGVLGCTTINAMIGAGSVFLFGGIEPSRLPSAMPIWWLSTAGGTLVFTPIVLMIAVGSPSWGSLFRRLESWVVLVLMLVTSLFAFFGQDFGLWGIAASMAPFPILVWAGSRLGPRGAILASFLVIVIATLATGKGLGPFMLGTANDAMIQLWVYSTFMGISAFTLAAVVEQGNAAEHRYRSEEAERLRAQGEQLLLTERERLTREMHDGLGGQLVSALSMVERGLAAPQQVAEAIRRALDDIRIVIDTMDAETTDLPAMLGKLHARLEPLLHRNGIDLRWRMEDISGLEVFPPETALHVLRIIQESVTNTLRHSGAGRVDMKIAAFGDEPRQLHVSIRDDGRGLPTPKPSGGRGLENMKFRAAELGAVLRTEGSRSGTLVDLTIPFPR